MLEQEGLVPPDLRVVLYFRVEGISVHYSVVFENNIHHATSETTREPEASADSGLKDMLAKALQEKASLPVDLDSLNFQPGTALTQTAESSAHRL